MRNLHFNWKVTLFSLVCLVVFIRLGFWQLERGDEKEQMLAKQELDTMVEPVSLSDVPVDLVAAQWVRVRLAGEWRDETFLLDNRVLDGRVGFEVLVPFHVAAFELPVLVNRGFVPMGRTRDEPVDIPEPTTGPVVITGHIYVPGEVQDESLGVPGGGATIIQIESPETVGRALGESFYPLVVRLGEEDMSALPRHWPRTVMSAEQHFGYAIQWFAMAAAVFILFMYFSFGRKRDA